MFNIQTYVKYYKVGHLQVCILFSLGLNLNPLNPNPAVAAQKNSCFSIVSHIFPKENPPKSINYI